MATYLIGDVHGCYDELIALLQQVDDPVVGHRTATKCWSKTCYRWSVSDTRLVVDREHTQRAGEFLR
ncbi:hypothetical protein MJL22_27275, partial [Salmonella enterica subsp. enterica serovar Montevideo]|nr:hypothetical protein [Salmonella enterica subsp. enterica serovar Montevideo]